MNTTVKKVIKIALIIIIAILVLIFLWLIVLGQLSKSGSALGIKDNKLQQCPISPNCVLSESFARAEQSIQPIEFVISPESSSDKAMSKLESSIISMGGKVINKQESYIAATFSSAILGFVDDLEVRIAGVSPEDLKVIIHFRSGSRVGKSDFGVNRKRVEQLKLLILK